MTGRDTALALGAIVVAIGIAALLLVGSLATAGPEEPGRARFFFVNFAGRVAPRVPSADPRNVPAPLRAVMPLQRGVSDTARDAAGYLLLVIVVSAVFVFGREGVLGAYRAARGGWRAQLRVLGTGLAVLLLLASAAFLASVVLLGSLASGFREAPAGIQLGLQVGMMTLAVIAAALVIAGLVGFTAAAWRLGDALFARGPLHGWSGRLPGALVALIGATILYLLAQLPAVGGALGVAIIAYALGTVVIARLGHGQPALG